MAKITTKMPDDFLLALTKLGDRTDEIVTKCLTAGADVARESVESHLRAVVGKNTKYKSRTTGDLVRALGITPVKINNKGNFDIKVGFAENRTDGRNNAMIANIIEYGKPGQPAKPFIKPAQKACEKEVVRVMQETFDKEVSVK